MDFDAFGIYRLQTLFGPWRLLIPNNLNTYILILTEHSLRHPEFSVINAVSIDGFY